MDEIYTGKLESEDEDQLPTAIRAAVLLLREKFADNDIPILRWSDSWVAVPLTVDVELPGRGPVDAVLQHLYVSTTTRPGLGVNT